MQFRTLLLASFLPLAFSIPISDLDKKTESIEGRDIRGLTLDTGTNRFTARADDAACLTCLFNLARQGYSSVL